MELETALALAGTLGGTVAAGTATEAGRAAWESLVSLARRFLRRGAAGQGDQTATAANDEPEDPTVLVGRIAGHARGDADFAARLCRWAEEHRTVIQIHHTNQAKTFNTIAPGSQVGKVVQAGDVYGDINL